MPGKVLFVSNEQYEARLKRLSAQGSGQLLLLDPVDLAGSITWNNAFHDFDFSPYLPSNVKVEAVLLAVDCSGATTNTISFRRNDDASALVNVTPDGVVIIPIDDDNIAEIKGPGGGTKIVKLYGYLT